MNGSTLVRVGVRLLGLLGLKLVVIDLSGVFGPDRAPVLAEEPNAKPGENDPACVWER